jgi:hypothetical protein
MAITNPGTTPAHAMTTPIFAPLLAGTVFFTGTPSRSGFCYHCERVSRWEDRTFQYRCTHCGFDPIEEAEGDAGPVAVAPLTPEPAGDAPAPRRWPDRFPTFRMPGAGLVSGLGRTPSLTS